MHQIFENLHLRWNVYVARAVAHTEENRYLNLNVSYQNAHFSLQAHRIMCCALTVLQLSPLKRPSL